MEKNPLRIVSIAILASLALFLSFSAIIHSGCAIKTDIDTVNTSAVFRCFVYEYVQMALLESDPIAELEASNVTIKWDNHTYNFLKKVSNSGQVFTSKTL